MVAMVAEPLHCENTPSPEAGVPTPRLPPPRCKYRLRFRKTGAMRLVSHHDLMQVFERMLRRAGLPVALTEGFHPQPRMAFALSLALGIAGCNEVVELELREHLPPESLQDRLAQQAPAGLEILSACKLEGKSSSTVRRAFYRLPLHPTDAEAGKNEAPRDDLAPALESLPQRCLSLLDQAHLWIERSRPRPRRLDIRPYLSDLRVEAGNLEMAVWVTPTGTARPAEYALLLGLEPLLEAGAFFERTHLEMTDEVSAQF
jgi:radical SAM-linked protein